MHRGKVTPRYHVRRQEFITELWSLELEQGTSLIQMTTRRRAFGIAGLWFGRAVQVSRNLPARQC